MNYFVFVIHILFFAQVVLACIATAHSSPFRNWMNEIEDLNPKKLLELQEQSKSLTLLSLGHFPGEGGGGTRYILEWGFQYCGKNILSLRQFRRFYKKRKRLA